MLELVDEFSDYQFVIAGAKSLDDSIYQEIIKGKQVAFVKDKTHALLLASEAALVTSGTATLETALLNIPEVVCYKGSTISYQIAKRIVDVKFISLVNLIMDKEVVKELLQDDLTAENLKSELKKILFDSEYRSTMLSNYEQLINKLGSGGASTEAANQVIQSIRP